MTASLIFQTMELNDIVGGSSVKTCYASNPLLHTHLRFFEDEESHGSRNHSQVYSSTNIVIFEMACKLVQSSQLAAE